MRTIRLTCEATNLTRIIDDKTGVKPVISKDDAIRIEVGIFEAGAAPDPATVDFVGLNFMADEAGAAGAIWLGDSVSANDSFVASQWRNGAGWMAAFEFTTQQMSGMNAATYWLVVTAQIDGEAVTYTAGKCDIIATPVIDGDPVNPEPEPPAAYTKAEADALFATDAALDAVIADVAGLSSDNVQYGGAQDLTAGEMLQARENIGAAAALSTLGAGAGATLELNFLSVSHWFLRLDQNRTLTVAANTAPTYGIGHTIAVRTITANAQLTWPTGWKLHPAALVHPRPIAAGTGGTTEESAYFDSAFRIVQARHDINPGAAMVQIEPLYFGQVPGDPAFKFDLRTYSRLTIASGNLTVLVDPASGNSCTVLGTAQPYLANGISGRPVVNCGGTGGYSIPTAPIEATMNAGVTVAVVFDSRTASDFRIMCLGPLGLCLEQRGGNLEFGSVTVTANRVTVPFTPNDSKATVAIFTFVPSLGGAAAMIKHETSVKVGWSATAAASTPTGNYELFQASGGSARMTGRVAHVSIYDRALEWGQVRALMAKLCHDYKVNPNTVLAP